MKKLFKQDFISTKESSQAKEEIKWLVSDSFSRESFSTFDKIHLNKWFSRSLWIIWFLSIPAIVLTAQSGLFILLFISSFLCALLPFWILACWLTKSSYRNKVDRKATQNHLDIFKLWFSKNYEDATIDNRIDLEPMANTAMAHPGANVTSDNSIWKITPGYTIYGRDGITIQSMTVNWGSVKSTIKNDSTFELKKAYFAVHGIKDVFKNIDFVMNQSKTSSKNKTNLENIDFNKKWSLFTKDAVKARMILTPSVQEDVLKTIKELDFQIECVDDFFWVSFNVHHFDSTFSIDLPMKSIKLTSQDEVVQKLIEVALRDVETFQGWLKTILVFRTLFKTI